MFCDSMQPRIMHTNWESSDLTFPAGQQMGVWRFCTLQASQYFASWSRRHDLEDHKTIRRVFGRSYSSFDEKWQQTQQHCIALDEAKPAALSPTPHAAVFTEDYSDHKGNKHRRFIVTTPYVRTIGGCQTHTPNRYCLSMTSP